MCIAKPSNGCTQGVTATTIAERQVSTRAATRAVEFLIALYRAFVSVALP